MDNNTPKMGINLLVRNLERNLIMVLNDYKEVPIEMQRIVMQGLLEKITNVADKTTQQELTEYQMLLEEIKKEEQNTIQEE